MLYSFVLLFFSFNVEFLIGLRDIITMGGQKITRRQKDISRVLREKKKVRPPKSKKVKSQPEKRRDG
ncbi:MAG: hypothetical protein ABFD50_12130 [Smithella sp.]